MYSLRTHQTRLQDFDVSDASIRGKTARKAPTAGRVTLLWWAGTGHRSKKKKALELVYFRHCQRRCLHSDIFERLLPCQVCRTSVAHILAAALTVKPKYEIWLNPNATQQWIQYGLSDFLDAWSQIDSLCTSQMGNVLNWRVWTMS